MNQFFVPYPHCAGGTSRPPERGVSGPDYAQHGVVSPGAGQSPMRPGSGGRPAYGSPRGRCAECRSGGQDVTRGPDPGASGPLRPPAGSTPKTTPWKPRNRLYPGCCLKASDPAVEAALIFGPEDRGLSNDELMYAQRWIRIPARADYPSLNLAQAVGICAYLLHRWGQSETLTATPQGRAAPLPQTSQRRTGPPWIRLSFFSKI